MKLELKHLAPYLPYNLMLYMDGFPQVEMKQLNPGINMDNFLFKPILRPLSDLYSTEGFSVSTMITHGYHNEFWSKEKFSVNHLYYHDLLILLGHHFDVFGLIDAGLAIDINTLNK